MCNAKESWIEALPTVLLGLRNCFKEDLRASPAEMLYGSTLRIPGEFFFEENHPADPEIFLEKHRIFMREIKSRPAAHHNKKTPFYHKNLYDCSHVWVRDDAVQKSLQAPYSGPFLIVNRINDYLFAVNIAGKVGNVSTERLKPAFLPKDVVPDLTMSDSSSVPLPSSSSTLNINTPSNTVPLRTYARSKNKIHFATL